MHIMCIFLQVNAKFKLSNVDSVIFKIYIPDVPLTYEMHGDIKDLKILWP